MKSLVDGLIKTKERLLGPLAAAFSAGRLNAEAIEEVEAVLLSSDIGVEATERIIEKMRAGGNGGDGYMDLVARELLAAIEEVPEYEPPAGRPRIIVVVGVNGVGKTSTIGKVAARFRSEGKSVLLAACDTFRAAAIEQLELWAERVDVPVVRQKMGSDPAAVAYDAVQSAIAKDIDIVVVDTAGRLHTKTNLMGELGKIFRVLSSKAQGAALEAWLVLDANAGQNSLRQAEVFVEALPVKALVLTKLDSTAKGGAVIPVQSSLGIPVIYAGVGEGVDDLQPFDRGAFVSAIVGR